jgi:hypothetical protein
MSFTSSWKTGELLVATESDCNARWSCGKPGEHFRCGFCGYKFKVGDKWRWLYCNDQPKAPGNSLVCEKCNDTNEKLIEKWHQKWEIWRTFTKSEEWWWFNKTFYSPE